MRFWKFFLPLLASSLCFAAQPDRIVAPIDSSHMVALKGHVHPLAKPENDLGPVQDSLQFDRLTLVIAPTPSQQAALDQLLAQQQDQSSPNYHKWLTPAQYADRFGLSQNDINRITEWLTSQGLKIVSVGGGRNSISVSGTAAQVESAFKVPIHRYNVNGKLHIANSAVPSVPAALSGVVTEIHGLTTFHPKPMMQNAFHGSQKGPHPYYTTTLPGDSAPSYFMAPGDVATMYDINPLYNTAIDGTGQKLAVIGQTDIYLADINDFRSGFGLSSINSCVSNSSGVLTSCNTANFHYVPVGTDLGTVYNCGDLSETDLDLEWSGAIARNAQIVFVNAPVAYDSNCNITSTTGGVFDALSAAINPPSGPPLAPVITLSYGLCEAQNESLETELQQANSEGVTVMNSSGDQGSAACDGSSISANPPYTPAQNGLAVSYPASSPEVTGVGGSAIPLNPSTNYSSANWASSNGANGSSLLNYITEDVWNDDEALAAFCAANTTVAFCNPATGVTITNAQTYQEYYWISAGGGGVSNCVTQSGGICTAGFGQPVWQSSLSIPGLTSPQNTYRYVPDVSLIASPNLPGYIYCTPIEYLSSTSPYDTETTSSCASGIQTAADGTVSGGNFVINPSIVGGTSASAPIFAGIVTLLNQYLSASAGSGNINAKLYQIAGDPVSSAFHHVSSGDNNAYCTPGTPTGQPADVICPSSGVIGFSATNSDANTGYNLAAGLGSVDANELALEWADSLIATTTTISAPANATGGLPVTLTANVTVSNSANPTGNVNFYASVSGTSTLLGAGTLSGGTATLTTSSLPFGGADMVTATYNGLYAPSTSSAANISVTTPDFMMALMSPLSPATIPAGQSTTATLVITPVTGADTINFSPSSCSGLPTGASCSFSNAGLVSFGGTSATGTITLTITTAANMTVPSGVQTITITGTESGTGGTTHTTTASFTITATNQSFTLAPTSGAATFSVNAGSSVQISFNVVGAGSPTQFSPATLPVTYTCTQSSLPSQAGCSWSPNNGSAVTSNPTLTITTTGPTSQLRSPLGRNSRLFYALLLPGMFGIVFASAGGRKQALRGTRLLGLIAVLGVSTLWLGSCGGSSNSSQNNSGTPAGSYSIVVNATTAGPNPLTATYTVKLTVTN